MSNRFITCLESFTWRPENDGQPPHTVKGDSGGDTSWGMTYKTYNGWAEHTGRTSITLEQFNNLPRESFEPIYLEGFWNAVHGDYLPIGLDLMAFDFAVTDGPREAVRALQLCLNLNADGVLGLVTQAVIVQHASSIDLDVFYDRQLTYLKSCHNYPTDGRGWTRRANDALAQAKLDRSKS